MSVQSNLNVYSIASLKDRQDIGLSKGKFLLYDEEKLDNELANYLNTNGGFLKKIPSNAPIRVKCHVYIIKVSIINPIHLIGKFDPYIYIECGDSVEQTEKIKTDLIEPMVGK